MTSYKPPYGLNLIYGISTDKEELYIIMKPFFCQVIEVFYRYNNMNLNIEENIFYLNEKIKLLTSAYNYELETSIFTKQLTKELDFIIYTINKIENKINFKIQNSITYKNLRLCLKTRISIKQFLELAIKIDNNIKIDHQFITDQLLSQAQSIQFLIQNIQLFSNESNSDIFISNEEMNMLFQ